MRPTLKYFLLAVINGTLSFAALATFERIDLYYDNLQFHRDMERGTNVGYLFEQPQLFWNIATYIFHLALFLVATLILRRFLSKRGSIFFFWVSVGVLVAIGWAVTLSIGIVTNALATGHSPLEMFLQSIIFRSSQRTGLISLALILGVNVLFGAVTQIAATHRWHGEPRYS